jgi:hypothetical protein
MSNLRTKRAVRCVVLAAGIGLIVLLTAAWQVRRHVNASTARRTVARKATAGTLRLVEQAASDTLLGDGSHRNPSNAGHAAHALFSPPPHFITSPTSTRQVTPKDVYFEPCLCLEARFSNPLARMNLNCPLQAPPRNSSLYTEMVVGGKMYRSSPIFTRRHGAVAEVRANATGMLPIDGLAALIGYVSEGEQAQILADVNQQEWQQFHGKHSQEYGFNFSFYNPTPTSVTIPPSILSLAERMVADGLLDPMPNYVLVDRYEPGEGSHPRVESDDPHDGAIASVTLGSGSVVRFSLAPYGPYFKEQPAHAELMQLHENDRLGVCRAAYFPTGSVFVIKDEARLGWRHEVQQTSSDLIPVMPDEIGAVIGAQLLSGSELPIYLVPGTPIRTNVTRGQRIALTLRYVRDEVRDARWARKSVGPHGHKIQRQG